MDLAAFFVLACGITFALDAPLVSHWLGHRPPPDWALGLAGLGAWGPTLAAVAVASRVGRVRDVFRPWATRRWGWIVLALALSLLLRLPATAAAAALGEAPDRWFHPPEKPESWIALGMFSFGEELGWRGFAQPRAIARWGPTAGPIGLGVVWTLWHLAMMVTPEGGYDLLQLALLLGIFPAYSVICARLMDRADGSLWVAVALHASGHLDNAGAAPPDELLMRAFYVAIVWAVALAIPAGPAPATGR